MLLVIKQIKPRRMKDKALRLTLLNKMRACGREIRRDFEKTTATWEHKPEFEMAISLTGPGPVMIVGTDDEIYRYVDEGTRPHEIWAGAYTGKSKKRALVFPAKSRPKTIPRRIASFRGYRSKRKLVRAMVYHPGTKAREFSAVLQKRWQPRFRTRMERTMKEVAKKSGHYAGK